MINNDSVEIVKDFLFKNYYHEPDDTLANISAMRDLGGIRKVWPIACAFSEVLEQNPEAIGLKDFVRKAANRFFETDQEAYDFINSIYHDTTLDCAVDPELLEG